MTNILYVFSRCHTHLGSRRNMDHIDRKPLNLTKLVALETFSCQEANMKELQPLDWVLLMHGCKITKVNHVITVINNLQLVTSLTLLSLQISFIAILIWNGNLTSLVSISVITYYIPLYVYGILFVLVMRSRQRSQYKFLLQVLTRTSPERRKRLQRLSSLSAFLVVAFNVLAAASYLSAAIRYQPKGTHKKLAITTYYIDTIVSLIGRWVVISCWFSAFIVQATSYFEQTFLDQLYIDIKEQKATVPMVLTDIHQVSLLKKKAMPQLGIVPCLVVAYLFCATAGLIAQFKHSGIVVETVTEIIFLLCYFLSLLYVTCISDRSTRVAVRKAESIESMVLALGKEEWRQVTGPLQVMAATHHQSCGLFTLNCKFFVDFIASLITFTALLTQLMVGVAKEK